MGTTGAHEPFRPVVPLLAIGVSRALMENPCQIRIGKPKLGRGCGRGGFNLESGKQHLHE